MSYSSAMSPTISLRCSRQLVSGNLRRADRGIAQNLAFDECAEGGMTHLPRMPMREKPALPFGCGIICRDEQQTFGSVRLAADQQVLANSLPSVRRIGPDGHSHEQP